MICGTPSEQKIPIDANTMTKMYHIKNRINLATPILDSLLRSLEQIQSTTSDIQHFVTQSEHCIGMPSTHTAQQLANAKETCCTFQRTAKYLIDNCSSTMDTLSKRLEFLYKLEVQKQGNYLLEDSVAVKVITFITLIFFPCTVVSVSSPE